MPTTGPVTPVNPVQAPLLPVSAFDRHPQGPAKDGSTTLSSASPTNRRPSSSSARGPLRRSLVYTGLVVGSLFLLGSYVGPSSAKERLVTSTSRWASWQPPNPPTRSSVAASGPVNFTVACGATSASAAPDNIEQRFERARRPLPADATLEDRLAAWEWDAPGWDVESAEWVRRNDEFCPQYRIRPNQNNDLLQNAHIVWHSLNTSRIMGLRKEMIDYLRMREQEGALSKEAWGEGKGLVFTAGNADTFSRVLLTLKMLRNHLHTTLPSEIFSFPGEEPSDEVRQELESYGAKLRIVESATRDPNRTKNFHIKATAIIRSRFREVLFLDSDNIPAASLMPADSPVPQSVLDSADNKSEPWIRVNGDGRQEEVWGKPSGLWEAKAYQRHGAMFWPDYWRTQADNAIWPIIGVPCRDEWEQEAGQILVDKSRNLDALLLAEWMMDSSRFKFWFNLSDGDKDMFRFAWLALRKRWGVPGRYVSVGALPRNTMSGFCGHTMLQNDHIGRPMFVHANLLKQIPSGVGRGNAWGRHRQVRTQPGTLTLEGTGASSYSSSRALEEVEPLEDEDIDCDMLADVSDDGFALGGTPSLRVRRRAVIEKGIRAGFHGGWNSALCIDTRWDDPRPDEDREDSPAADGFEVRWDRSEALEVVQWGDDLRLKGFEEAFFAEGGKLNGKGF